MVYPLEVSSCLPNVMRRISSRMLIAVFVVYAGFDVMADAADLAPGSCAMSLASPHDNEIGQRAGRWKRLAWEVKDKQKLLVDDAEDIWWAEKSPERDDALKAMGLTSEFWPESPFSMGRQAEALRTRLTDNEWHQIVDEWSSFLAVSANTWADLKPEPLCGVGQCFVSLGKDAIFPVTIWFTGDEMAPLSLLITWPLSIVGDTVSLFASPPIRQWHSSKAYKKRLLTRSFRAQGRFEKTVRALQSKYGLPSELINESTKVPLWRISEIGHVAHLMGKGGQTIMEVKPLFSSTHDVPVSDDAVDDKELLAQAKALRVPLVESVDETSKLDSCFHYRFLLVSYQMRTFAPRPFLGPHPPANSVDAFTKWIGPVRELTVAKSFSLYDNSGANILVREYSGGDPGWIDCVEENGQDLIQIPSPEGKAFLTLKGEPYISPAATPEHLGNATR